MMRNRGCGADRQRRDVDGQLAERLAQSGQPDRIASVRSSVQSALVEALGPKLYDMNMTAEQLELRQDQIVFVRPSRVREFST